MEKVKIGLLGFGTVGQGTYELLKENKTLIEKRLGLSLEVATIFLRNPDKYCDYPFMEETKLTTDVDTILADSSIQIIVEVMGGTTFAAECIERALLAKKHVVTANKDLIATKGVYFQQLAEKEALDLRYEASVLGGIPIIRPLFESLNGNKITELIGIMNGTTNFILTKMTEEGMGYSEALKEAQELGYAEADPTADVEGYDAARKLAILSSITFNRRIFFEDVDVEGISSIDKEDIDYAKEFNYIIKLIGIAKETKKGLSLNVYPAFLNKDHPLSAVRGAYNAIYVKGNGIGDAMFYGKGAGGFPTGSSVVSDIMEIAKNISMHATGRLKQFYFPDKNIYAPGKIKSSYYIRLEVDNSTGVLAMIASKLAEHRISARSVIQRDSTSDFAVLAIVTNECPRSYVLNCIDSFNSLLCVRKVHSVIRVMAEE